MQRIVNDGWRLCRMVLVCLLAARALPAAEPFLEKTNLFTEATDGFRLYRIPGIVVTARGSVLAYSDLAVLPDGTVLCFYESGDAQAQVKHGRPWAYSFLTLARFHPDWLTSTESATCLLDHGLHE